MRNNKFSSKNRTLLIITSVCGKGYYTTWWILSKLVPKQHGSIFFFQENIILTIIRHTYTTEMLLIDEVSDFMIQFVGWFSIFLCTDISSGSLEGHSGSIQAALNLEFTHEKVSSFHVAIEGINGQLPNLDLVNTVFRLCRKERIPAALHTEVKLIIVTVHKINIDLSHRHCSSHKFIICS